MAKRVNLSKRLKAWRKREKLTQDEAAKLLDLNPSTYIQYENKRRGSGMSEFQYQHILKNTAPRPRDALNQQVLVK